MFDLQVNLILPPYRTWFVLVLKAVKIIFLLSSNQDDKFQVSWSRVTDISILLIKWSFNWYLEWKFQISIFESKEILQFGFSPGILLLFTIGNITHKHYMLTSLIFKYSYHHLFQQVSNNTTLHDTYQEKGIFMLICTRRNFKDLYSLTNHHVLYLKWIICI